MNNAIEVGAPWIPAYGKISPNLTYPSGSMSDVVLAVADNKKTHTALSCMGTKISYGTFKSKILSCAAALTAYGVKAGDRVVICMPNLPQTVYMLYALNYIGAVACLIHPLSAVEEIKYYLDEVGANAIFALDTFYEKIAEAEKQRKIEKVLLTRAADELGFIKKAVYNLVNAKKTKIESRENVTFWGKFLSLSQKEAVPAHLNENALSVILFSGGTTGITKGIMLSSKNFNAAAKQTEAMAYTPVEDKKMLAAMPCFHGFGLGVCIHTMMVAGGEAVLVPKFNVKDYATLIKKCRPNYIAGVPTLYEALTRCNYLDNVKLDCLLGVFSGGDKLTPALKEKFDAYLAAHGATVKVREGYGMTECLTASCLTPFDREKAGSIGIPFPDTYYAICKVGTTEQLPIGEEGEICISGPSVMLGYYGREEETANTLKKHADGKIWLHTGDLGCMDEEGFIYFKQRIKRMIVTSGYNVYPSQIESVLDKFEAIDSSCVIGVKDAYRMQKVKAFVVLKDGYAPTKQLKQRIMDYCKKHIAKYALPSEIEFRDELPKTRLGKVAYTELEE